MTATTEATRLTPVARARAILGGSAGNLVEWYDWFAYAAFTLYFAPAFFPKGDQTVQLLQAAAVFFLGFVARPIGAWIMGLYADHAGRRAALSVSVSLMCAGAFIIAITPDFQTIGLWAPAILLFARVLQGLSVGGEYGASATYMSEMAGKARRGFWSSFHYVTLIAGQLLALGVLIILQRTLGEEALKEWAWRVPFIIGALLAVVVFWIRRGLEESVSFKRPAQSETLSRGQIISAGAFLSLTIASGVVGLMGGPLAKAGQYLGAAFLVLFFVSLIVPLIRRHPRESLLIMGLTAGGSLTFYVYTTYMQKFLVNTAGFSKAQASEISALSLIAFMLMQPLAGWLSDRFGRKPMLIIAFGGGVLTIWPIMTAISQTNSVGVALALILVGVAFQSCYTAISAVVKAEMFPAEIRALGVALPYALANVLFGGTAEMVALAFKHENLESTFYVYVAAVMTIGLICSIILKDTGRHSLIHED
ncbi:MFS transporter [Caulobacter vibrioides]|uniref:Major facilitator family transporter n=2 Tax=Caulobacter vibrioides TaxID=155892 RepID=Q9A9G9_CAUVC|nr:MFS transporter [Caulobacter vibrioides]YP_002516444.1 alpha-ketoglutarate permease [Caulobacter vibrioides NA1000]AAK23003.1 major facilitator family transporter [Caulobacter vibrioides CB15]ACL94536.1 alpha-ketoglutarate permease [Caulobacter vibrioides NA1000]ATC27853.1 alpha-ketoglutarate permease [Caulobacter vibrioides]QXZ53097.1 MFS transporter [Caulobacter vibrioides]